MIGESIIPASLPYSTSQIFLNRREEAMMKARILMATALLLGFAGTALADEYYVVESPGTHHCTITTTKPADREVVTQIGPLAFTTREEAEDRIKQTKVCTETTGAGDTVIKKKTIEK